MPSRYLQDLMGDDFGTGGSPSGFRFPNSNQTDIFSPQVQPRRASFGLYDDIEMPTLSTRGMDAYSSLLDSPPVRQKPGITQKILASLAGASEGYRGGVGRGILAAQNILDMGYNRDMEDYAQKERILRTRASIEQDDNEAKYRNYVALLRNRSLQENQIRDDEALERHREYIRSQPKPGEWSVQKDLDTGEAFSVNKITGQKIPLGKMSPSAAEKADRQINTAIKTAEGTSPIIEGRQSRLAQLANTLGEGRDVKRSTLRIGEKIAEDALGTKPDRSTAGERSASERKRFFSELQSDPGAKRVWTDIQPFVRMGRDGAPEFINLTKNNESEFGSIALSMGYDIKDPEQFNKFMVRYNQAKQRYLAAASR